MKKAFKTYALIWAIIFVVFNVICFAVPKEITRIGTGSFWISYLFIALAFVGQLICAYIAFKADTLQKLFYNIPIIRTSYIGLVVMLIAGAVVMLVPAFPKWLGIIICVIVLAFTAIGVIKANAAGNVVSEIDDKIKAKTLFIKSLTADAEGLIEKAQSDEAKAECKKLYDAIRYSDPMSNEALAGIESQITIKIAEIEKAINENNLERLTELSNETQILVSDRNRKCKVFK